MYRVICLPFVLIRLAGIKDTTATTVIDIESRYGKCPVLLAQYTKNYPDEDLHDDRSRGSVGVVR